MRRGLHRYVNISINSVTTFQTPEILALIVVTQTEDEKHFIPYTPLKSLANRHGK